MKVLGRDLIDEFTCFWSDIRDELDITEADINSGKHVVFGDQSIESHAGDYPGWMELPDRDLAYHVAHEVAHQLLRKRGYPRIARGTMYGPESSEARVGGDLEELVIHIPLDCLLRGYGMSPKVIVERMFTGTMKGICNSPVPEYGTPWFFTWAIRYAELSRTLTCAQMEEVDSIFKQRSNDVRSLGKEILEILEGFSDWSPSITKDAMIACRDILGLGVDERVLVVDGRDGSFA